jgi:NOL1/NOP2/fmu family ribosome biogenesis protein
MELSFTKLHEKKKENIILYLEDLYKTNLDNLREYFFYIYKSGRIYIGEIDIYNTLIKELKLNKIISTGIYFGREVGTEKVKFRLSLEGSKLVNPKDNFLILNYTNLKKYLSKENMFENEIEELHCENLRDFIIVKYKNFNLGTMSKQESHFLNYLSKGRKIECGKLI